MKTLQARASGLPALLFAVLLCALSAAAPAEGLSAGTDPGKGPVAKELEDGLLVQFEILPRPIKAMKDLVFSVTLSRAGKPVTDAELLLDLTMPAMYMGKNSPVLTQAGAGRFEAKGLLPRCMSGDKRWQAELLIREGTGTHRVVFLFETT
ncbi:MAG: hypothetical protein WCL50_17430 [Spirochaetota bacterium]